MDKARVLTGLALAVMMLALILGLSTAWLAVVLLAFFVLAAGEWAALTGLVAGWQYALYLLAILLCAGAAWLAVSWGLGWVVVTLGGVWWSLAAALLLAWQPDWDRARLRWWLRWAGAPTLVPAWIALVLVHRYDPWLLVYLVAVAALGDSAAYFAGKRFGRHKMAPRLSPGKTWEGLLGEWGMGLAMAALGAFVFIGDSWWERLEFFGVVMVTILISVNGDLFESLLKRVAGVKDSGHLLPGHGGVLDRLDSHLAAAPVFLLGILLMGGHIR